MRKNKFVSRTPWIEKMGKPARPEVKEAPVDWAERYGGHRMLIPTPRAIEKIIMKIPKGKLLTTVALRKKLAKKYEADFSCPLTTGIFLRILSEFVEEQIQNKETSVAPYWRVIKEDGSLLEKIHGGPKHQSELLNKEKFKIVQRTAKKFVVKDFENYLLQ